MTAQNNVSMAKKANQQYNNKRKQYLKAGGESYQ
jgi:hypothetical protein